MTIKNPLTFVVCAAAALVAAVSAGAAEVSIPNTFQAGTPAKATEINDNFSALKSAVDANGAADATLAGQVQAHATTLTQQASAISGLRNALVVKAGGSVIGLLVGVGDSYFLLLSDKDYFFDVAITGELVHPEFYYASSGCTGQAYVMAYRDVILNQGYVFTDGTLAKTIYYVPRGTPIQVLTPASWDYGTGTSCSAYTFTRGMAMAPISPNDASVTGVSTNQFAIPITLGH